MPRQHSTAVPASIAARPLRTFRTGQAKDVYAHPAPEIARLHDRGLIHRLADGYYVVVPQDMLGRRWIPTLEAAAAGIASAIYGHDEVVIMGLSAARLHGAIPRALATAVVATPRQHRPIALSDRSAVVRFVQRDTSRLDAERVATDLGPVMATTPEQTVIDLAHRPSLGDGMADVPTAVAALYARSDEQRLAALAAGQRRAASLRRAKDWAATVRAWQAISTELCLAPYRAPTDD